MAPDRLLEISERIYVFDCCFSTEALEEDKYKNYLDGIVAELKNCHPDSAFMVFNFREDNKRTRISGIMLKHSMTVMEYPRQYKGYPMLPLEMIYNFLQFSISWMSLAGQQNVLLMHCERGGWPVIAFMLAALLLFRKQYNGEQKTLEMVYKQAPREILHLLTPLNPQPSQLRYLRYISRRDLGSYWPPSDTPLSLDCIILRVLPTYGKEGCRPVVRIYDQDSPSTTAKESCKPLLASSKAKKHACYYQPEKCELVKIDINQHVRGDVVLECIHLDHVREVMMFRVMFHTTFVRNHLLMLNHDDVDVMWDARVQIPKDFRAELLFSDILALPSMNTTAEWREPDIGESLSILDMLNNKQDKEESHGEKLGKDDSQQKMTGNISWKKSVHVSYPLSTYGSQSSRPSTPSMHAAPYSSPRPPPPPPIYASPSPRHVTSSYRVPAPPAPPPPPSPPSAPASDVSKGGLQKPIGSETEEIHMVPFPDADSLEFWDEFWKKVDARFIEEKPTKLW